MLDAVVLTPEQREELDKLGIYSMMLVPLVAATGTVRRHVARQRRVAGAASTRPTWRWRRNSAAAPATAVENARQNTELERRGHDAAAQPAAARAPGRAGLEVPEPLPAGRRARPRWAGTSTTCSRPAPAGWR